MNSIIEYLYCMIYAFSFVFCIKKYLDRNVLKVEFLIFIAVYGLVNYIITSSFPETIGIQIIMAIFVIVADYFAICLLNKKMSLYLLFYTLLFETLFTFIVTAIPYAFVFIDGLYVSETFSPSILRFTLVILFNLLTIVCFRFLEKRKVIAEKDVTKRNGFVLCVTNILIQFVFSVFQWINIIGEANVYIYFILAIFTLIWLILLYMMNKTFVLNEEREINVINESINLNVEQYMRLYRQDEEVIHKIKHDIKNHFLIINNLNSLEEIHKYTQKIFKEFDSINISSEKISGNLHVDAILSSKQLEYPSVQFKSEVHINDLQIDNYYLSVLLFNLIDNACIAASAVKGHVDIHLLYEDPHMIIEIKNTCRRRANLTSTKGENHGYGLKIINDVVNKYNGNIEYELNENTTVVRVILIV